MIFKTSSVFISQVNSTLEIYEKARIKKKELKSFIFFLIKEIQHTFSDYSSLNEGNEEKKNTQSHDKQFVVVKSNQEKRKKKICAINLNSA